MNGTNTNVQDETPKPANTSVVPKLTKADYEMTPSLDTLSQISLLHEYLMLQDVPE